MKHRYIFRMRGQIRILLSLVVILLGLASNRTATVLPVAAQTNSVAPTSPKPCTVCPDGNSTIALPDAEIEVPGIGLLTCGVVDVGVEFLLPDDTSPKCKLLRDVSGICGCPSLQESPCQFCPEGFIVPRSRKDSKLPFLNSIITNVEPTSDMDVTCGLLEAYLLSVDKLEPTCILARELMGNYCCVEMDTDVENRFEFLQPDVEPYVPPETPCDICQGQGTFRDPDLTVALLPLGDDITMSCDETQEASSLLVQDGTENCDVFQSVISRYCSCGDEENVFNAVSVPCTLCKDGSSVIMPDRKIPFLADQFFGVEPTCSQMEEIAALYDEHSDECSEAHLISSYCGCPTAANPCVFCPATNDTITDPTRRHTNIFVRSGEDVTCEQLEAVLLQYDADSAECFLGHETNWECGCNDGFYGYLGMETDHDQKLFANLGKITSSLSILGSVFIIQDYFRGERGSVYRQIMVCMAVFDFISATAWMIGSLAVPRIDIDGNSSNIYGAGGNDKTCTAQVRAVNHTVVGC